MRWATKARGLLWLLMDAPDKEGSNIVGADPDRLEAVVRIPLSLETPAGSFALDLEQDRAIVALPEEAALLVVQFGDLPDEGRGAGLEATAGGYYLRIVVNESP